MDGRGGEKMDEDGRRETTNFHMSTTKFGELDPHCGRF